MKQLVVYIAGPFRGDSAWKIEKNIRVAEEASLEIWRNGHVALCPHLNTRFFQGELPDDVWLRGDLELLRRCDVVYMVGDWQKSTGAKEERQFALANNVPVSETLEGVLELANILA